MGTPSQGAQANLALDAATPVDGSSEPYEFISQSLTEVVEHLQTNGIRGTRSRSKERNREGNKRIEGSITLHPSPADLDNLLPRILGAAESTDTFALAETLPSFSVGVDLVADAFEYLTCYVNRATFRASAGGLLELTMDILGTSKTDLTFPSLTLGTAANDAPYTFADCTGAITLESSARESMDIEIVIDNALDARFINAQTAGGITPQDRNITVKVTTPYTSDEVALNTAAFTGAAGSVVFTNGGMSTTFTFANLQLNPKRTPTVNGKSEITQSLEYQAFKSGSTNELEITHDSVA